MSRRAASLLAVLVVILGVCSCGGPSADEQRQDRYVAAIDQARATLARTLQRLEDQTEPTGTPATDARTLAGYERAVAAARLELRNVPVPENVTTQHKALLAALRSYEVALSRARAAGAKTANAKIAAQREALETAADAASGKVDAAVAAIRAALTAS